MRHFAGVIVVDEHERVLAIKLKDKTPAWRIPGGKVENFESPKEAATRELREEVGLEHCILTYLGHNFVPADGDLWTGYIFTTRLWPQQERPRNCEPHKIEAMEWVTPEELATRNDLLREDLMKFRALQVKYKNYTVPTI